jgi:uncharacterized protein
MWKDWTEKFEIINVPGYGGSGEEHWQTFWEMANPAIKRVEQADWDHPEKETWVKQLADVVKQNASKPVILMAHSLGCGMVVHAVAEGFLDNVVAVFLVALPDMERADFPKDIIGFSPVPRLKLPFPSTMIASETDPYITIEKIEEWANILGSEFINLGDRDHIGSAAQLGYWEEGMELFDQFMKKLELGK